MPKASRYPQYGSARTLRSQVSHDTHTPSQESCLRIVESSAAPRMEQGRLSKIRNTRAPPRLIARSAQDFNLISRDVDRFHGTQMLLARASLQHPLMRVTPINPLIKDLTILYTSDTGHDVKWKFPRGYRQHFNQISFVFLPRLTIVGDHMAPVYADPARFAPSLFAALCLKWAKRIYVVGVTDNVRARVVAELDHWNSVYRTKATMASVTFISARDYFALPESGDAFNQDARNLLMGLRM